LIVILGCYAILRLRERAVERKHSATPSEAPIVLQGV
jgi:hypothetical protein